jgi:hypothetical protein
MSPSLHRHAPHHRHPLAPPTTSACVEFQHMTA